MSIACTDSEEHNIVLSAIHTAGSVYTKKLIGRQEVD